jgi:GTPase SAR1 family protein
LIGTCDAFLVIYSVVDKASFNKAEELLNILQEMDLLRSNACILVGNKIDLARSRAVSTQGNKFIFFLNSLLIFENICFISWKMFGLHIPSQVC